jgi:hypothetical protein
VKKCRVDGCKLAARYGRPECQTHYMMRKRSEDRVRYVNRVKGERAPLKGNICFGCYDLPHRRPACGCWKCGGEFAEESVRFAPIQSSIVPVEAVSVWGEK